MASSKAKIYDPETIEFPLAGPKLRLSTSDEPYNPTTGLHDLLDIYAEKFGLSKLLTNTVGSGDVSLHVHELSLPVESGFCVLSLPGKPASRQEKQGGNGGTLNLYVEELPLRTARRLLLKANGADGYSPAKEIGSAPHVGGNGGNGGHINVVFDTILTQAAKATEDILAELAKPESKWPADFRKTAVKLISLLGSAEVLAVGYHSPSIMKTVEGVLGQRRREILTQVVKLYDLLTGNPQKIQGILVQNSEVSGGNRGFGTNGGSDGKHGEYGQRSVELLQDYTAVQGSTVCFAHPLQCQMLLDKANFLTYSDTDQNTAVALGILNRLVRRLGIFAGEPIESNEPVKPDEPILWKAYRDNHLRLFTPKDLSGGEPIAIRQLRGIRKDAEAVIRRIRTGKDFFGKMAGEVPRGSFHFYGSAVENLLRNVKSIESLFLSYWSESRNAASELASAQQRSNIIGQRARLNDRLLADAKADLAESATKIRVYSKAVSSARAGLLDSMHDLDDFVNKSFGVKFDDYVSALSSTIFAAGGKPMAAMSGLELVSLLHKGTTQLLADNGAAVEKSFLIQELHDVEGSIQGLMEGYKVLKDRKLKLEDPGGEKMLIAKDEWEKLVLNFRQAMDSQVYEKVKEEFRKFCELLRKRNEEVLHYNSAITLLVQYCERQAQLRLDQTDVTRTEYDHLDAGHPAMTSFLKKTYVDSIQAAQMWLYKKQQAFRFVSLQKHVNIIGRALQGLPMAGLNYSLLEQLHGSLNNAYHAFQVSPGQPPQLAKAKIDLGHDDVKFIQYASHRNEDIYLRNIEIRPDHPEFSGMYDVRLMAVRFYAAGATSHTQATKSRPATLQAVITHPGTETMVDRDGTSIDFNHQPLRVFSKYELPSHDSVPPQPLMKGTISLKDDKDDIYARVGPFTTWSVDILKLQNQGLDLTKVSKAYLEFDYQFRTLMKGVALFSTTVPAGVSQAQYDLATKAVDRIYTSEDDEFIAGLINITSGGDLAKYFSSHGAGDLSWGAVQAVATSGPFFNLRFAGGVYRFESNNLGMSELFVDSSSKQVYVDGDVAGIVHTSDGYVAFALRGGRNFRIRFQCAQVLDGKQTQSLFTGSTWRTGEEIHEMRVAGKKYFPLGKTTRLEGGTAVTLDIKSVPAPVAGVSTEKIQAANSVLMSASNASLAVAMDFIDTHIEIPPVPTGTRIQDTQFYDNTITIWINAGNIIFLAVVTAVILGLKKDEKPSPWATYVGAVAGSLTSIVLPIFKARYINKKSSEMTRYILGASPESVQEEVHKQAPSPESGHKETPSPEPVHKEAPSPEPGHTGKDAPDPGQPLIPHPGQPLIPVETSGIFLKGLVKSAVSAMPLEVLKDRAVLWGEIDHQLRTQYTTHVRKFLSQRLFVKFRAFRFCDDTMYQKTFADAIEKKVKEEVPWDSLKNFAFGLADNLVVETGPEKILEEIEKLKLAKNALESKREVDLSNAKHTTDDAQREKEEKNIREKYEQDLKAVEKVIEKKREEKVELEHKKPRDLTLVEHKLEHGIETWRRQHRV